MVDVLLYIKVFLYDLVNLMPLPSNFNEIREALLRELDLLNLSLLVIQLVNERLFDKLLLKAMKAKWFYSMTGVKDWGVL